MLRAHRLTPLAGRGGNAPAIPVKRRTGPSEDRRFSVSPAIPTHAPLAPPPFPARGFGERPKQGETRDAAKPPVVLLSRSPGVPGTRSRRNRTRIPVHVTASVTAPATRLASSIGTPPRAGVGRRSTRARRPLVRLVVGGPAEALAMSQPPGAARADRTGTPCVAGAARGDGEPGHRRGRRLLPPSPSTRSADRPPSGGRAVGLLAENRNFVKFFGLGVQGRAFAPRSPGAYHSPRSCRGTMVVGLGDSQMQTAWTPLLTRNGKANVGALGNNSRLSAPIESQKSTLSRPWEGPP